MIIDKSRIGKVLAVYGSASFIVLQVIDLFEERLSLPEWTFAAALILLLIGLPIIVTTTLVQSNEFKSALVEKHFTWRRAIGGGVVAFVMLSGVAAFYARDRFGGDEPLDRNLVAVFPFRVNGADASLSYLAEGMVDLVGAKLSGDVGTRAADTRATLAAWRRIGEADPDTAQLVRAARSIGARRMILGAVVGNQAQMTVTASVTDTRTGRTVQHFVTGPAEQLPQKVDELIAALLSLDAREPLDRMAALTSTSLPATRAYLLAEDNFRRGLYLDASKRYVEALNADSSFALSALGLIVTAGWDERIPGPEVARARKLAWAHRDRLSALDQLVLTGHIGAKYPEPPGEVTRCAVFSQITKSAPDRAQQWHDAADCTYHFWRIMGLGDREKARTQFEKSLALDSTFVPNIQHLISLAAVRRDAAEAKRLTRLFFAQDTTSPQVIHARWHGLYAENRPARELLAATDSMISTVLFDLALWAVDNVEDVVLVDSLYARALNRMRVEAPDEVPPAVEYGLAMMRGNQADVERVFARVTEGNPAFARAFSLVSALYADVDSAYAARNYTALEEMIAKPAAALTAQEAALLRQALCHTEQWRLWNGDASRTESVLRALRTKEGDLTSERDVRTNASAAVCASVVEAIRATVERRPDARAQALRLDSISATGPYYANASAYIRLVASRLLELNNEPALARTAARRFAVEFQPLSYYMAELLQDARLSAKLGERERAIQNYRRFLAFRAHATGVYARSTEQVRGELAALIDQ